MSTTLNMTLLLRRAEFADSCILAAGEPGFHTGTKVLKIGDGTTTWAELPFANQTQIEALIKVVDDKVKALDDTFATDKELEDGLALKADLATYNAYVADRQLTDTQINAEFAKYTTTTAQTAIDAEQDRRIGVLEAKPFDTYATKTEVEGVAKDLSDYETANNNRVKAVEDTITTYGDIVTHNVTEFATAAQGKKADDAAAAIATYGDIVTHDASDFETAGAASEAEGRINETLKSYYTKTEADAAFTTPAEVIAEVNKALSEVSNADTITNITTLVEYVNEHGGDLTELISEVYGSAEMTGDSRIDLIEGALNAIDQRPGSSITEENIINWNGEVGAKALAQGVKDVVDANKATWDKAGTALQAADLADYAKTADVVTNDEFTTFEAANTEAIGKKLDTATFEAFNNGTSKTVAAIEADIVEKASAAESAAKGHADSLNTAMDGRVAKLENNDAGYATKSYVDSLDHEDTTYTVSATENALEFTVTPDGKGEAQTIKLVAPTVNTGVMEVAAGEDIVVTPGENGKVTVAHAAFTTGEYTKTPSASDKTGDVYMMTGVTVDNGHVTGANVQSLAHALMGMKFIFDGGTSAN